MPEVRAAAARCLAAVAGGQSLARELPRAEQQLKPDQRALLRELCYGSLRQYWRLDGLVRPCLAKPFKPKDRDLFMLLCLGIYQLDHMRIPAHAAINVTVNACKALRKDWAKGLTNAVLRRYQRERETLSGRLSPAAQAAHPDWLFDAILSAWPEQAAAVLDANNQHPPLCLRNNSHHQTRADYLLALAAASIPAKPCAFARDGIRLEQAVDVRALPGFAEGRVSVQDESAQLCAELLSTEPGMRVLDACAAPGGKTGHLLETQPALDLLALDHDPQRLERVADNLERLGLRAELKAGDAAEPEHWWDGRAFDRILLDAPCSATGVIRRNPDIKLHRRASDIAALADTQSRLLQALWPLLKSGGQLLYATCSVLPRENEQVIESFLAQTADARGEPIDTHWGLARTQGRQLLPENDSHDGFYYALLRKS